MTSNERLDPGHYIGWIILVALFAIALTKSCAQTKAKIDTVICKTECIDKIVEFKTTQGKIKYYAVYNDLKNDISELIPVPQSTLTYLNLCKQNSIKPSLGIKLKDGQIVSIIRYKNRYIRKRI